MITLHFKPDELAALMNHCLLRMAQVDLVARREDRKRNLAELEVFTFWNAIYVKLEQVFRCPACIWCDSRTWDLDDTDTIPDEADLPPHEHLFTRQLEDATRADAP